MSDSPYRIFFDTSAFITGLLSPTGAAGALLRLTEGRTVHMVVSELVITEADRTISQKAPHLLQESRRLWQDLAPEVIANPDIKTPNPFLKKLAPADASILRAAHLAKVSVFVTWNTRDFMAPGIASLVNFPILVPGDTLKHFRAWIDPFLDHS